jgi:hypothetical protein
MALAYFKIGDTDFSTIVNELKVQSAVNYSAQTNAAGNTIVDYINRKKVIEVSIIPLEDTDLMPLLAAIEDFHVSVTYRNPVNGLLETLDCIIPQSNVEYYTIQTSKVMYKALTLQFTEL